MKRPFHAHWYVTTRCNSRCKFCSIWSDPIYKSSESSIIHRKALLLQLKKLGIVSIDFTGGEPLLYPRLPELIQYAHKLGFFTSLTTNGTLYPKFATALKGNLSSLSFSLDGPTAETHNKLRGINCFHSVIKSILIARRLGELVLLKTTVTKNNIQNIPKLIDLAQKLGVLIELNAEFSYFNNPRLRDENIEKLFQFWKHPNVIISHAHLQFMKDGGNDITRPKCLNGSTVIILSPNDRLFVPCMHKVYNVIPLEEFNLEKTLHSPTMENEREWMGRHPYCQFCTIPCYFEPTYYTTIDKYFALSLFSRIGYIKKRLVLASKLKN